MEDATGISAPVVSSVSSEVPQPINAVRQRIADYAELTKPRILIMILLTTVVAMVAVQAGPISWSVLIHTVIGTGLVAASASAMNQVIERHRDRLMTRTAKRPLAAGRLSVAEAAIFGLSMVLVGSFELAWFVNPATAWLGFATWALYVGLYTPLKTISWLNTAVGTVPGAMPVLMGWAAAGGSLTDIRAWLLFAVVVLWQFPHFMAIAWLYRHQYAAAGYQMLTTVDPTGLRAGRQGLLGAIALLPVSWYVLEPVGWFSVLLAVFACLVAASQVRVAWYFFRSPDQQTARRLLRGSLLYLPAMLMLMVFRALI